MNHTAAYIAPRPIGFWAMVRLPKDAKARPIMEDGKPKRFDDAYSALRAATDALEGYLNTPMRRDGSTLSACRSEAEKLFDKVTA